MPLTVCEFRFSLKCIGETVLEIKLKPTYWHALCPYLVLLPGRQLLEVKHGGVCAPAAPQLPAGFNYRRLKTFPWVLSSGASKFVQTVSKVIRQLHSNKMTTLRAVYGGHLNMSFGYCAIQCRIFFYCYKIFTYTAAQLS